jgi:hypothetical protein
MRTLAAVLPRTSALLAALLLVPACAGEREDKTPWESTPDGFTVVWYDQGTVSTGLLDKATLYAEFDAAMQLAADAMLVQYGTPRDTFLAAARVHKFRLHDNIFFYYSGQRVFGYHEDNNDFNEIGVAYWPYLTDPDTPDPAAPEWTHYYSNISNLWYWGVHDVTRLYAALKHEVGHHLMGPGFEH